MVCDKYEGLDNDLVVSVSNERIQLAVEIWGVVWEAKVGLFALVETVNYL